MIWAARLLAIAIFLASGCAGMVYEISWSRQFGNTFGHTVHTSAAVLASFLGGLAVGYLLATKFPRWVHPLAAYGVMELLAAGWVCIVPLLLPFASQGLLGSLEPGPWYLYAILRAVFCFFVLLPATAPLGASWPLMAAWLSPTHEPSPRMLSIGYACNTAGAVVGSLAAAAWMVELGVAGSSYVAAGLSTICGAAALVLARLCKPKTVDMPPNEVAKEPIENERVPLRWWLLVSGSGFALLALEVLYLRLFSLVFHNSTYTFGAVVAVFVLALALGAMLTGFIGRWLSPAALAGAACGYGAVGIALSLAMFLRETGFRYFQEGETFQAHLTAAFGLVAWIVLPPVTALGMLLPVAWRAMEPRPADARQIAGLTAASTLAGAIGSLAASFLLPWCGLWWSFALLGAAYFAVGLGVMLARGKRLQALTLIIVAILVGGMNVDRVRQARSTLPGDTLLRRWETPYGWIDAVQLPDDSLYIRQNLHYGFGSSKGSVLRDYRQGHLPLMLHGNARDVAYLGMGTGQTAAAALEHPELESIVVVELIAEAVEAARYLSETNHGLVDDPHVEIQVQDARRFLAAGQRKFDVIVADLFVPWESHTGYLYTVEHYQAGRRSLKPGGLFCQWLPLYQMGPRDLEMIADSFASVFPHTTLWWVFPDATRPVMGLIGTEAPIPFAKTAAPRGWKSDDANTGRPDPWLADERGILSLLVGDWKVRNPQRLNTDEHPRVEFSAPMAHTDNRKLRTELLHVYFEQILAQLTGENVDLTGVGPPGKDPAWRRNEQRKMLRLPVKE